MLGEIKKRSAGRVCLGFSRHQRLHRTAEFISWHQDASLTGGADHANIRPYPDDAPVPPSTRMLFSKPDNVANLDVLGVHENAKKGWENWPVGAFAHAMSSYYTRGRGS